MKKRILVFGALLTACSLTALGYINWDSTAELPKEKIACATDASDYDPVHLLEHHTKIDLLYKVDSRFVHRVTKEKLGKAESLTDILPAEALESIVSIKSIRVVLFNDEGEISETVQGDVLNTAQKQLLRATDYTSNFYITADCQKKSGYVSLLEPYDLVYYISVIPEKEAQYKKGSAALINYLRENSKEETAHITKDQLRPGQVRFRVTKAGEIANVQLLSTSGYLAVDEVLVKLITDLPGEWEPATNASGKLVDQEFIFFFGMEGC